MKKRRAFALTVAVPVFLIAYQTAPAMAHTPKTVKTAGVASHSRHVAKGTFHQDAADAVKKAAEVEATADGDAAHDVKNAAEVEATADGDAAHDVKNAAEVEGHR